MSKDCKRAVEILKELFGEECKAGGNQWQHRHMHSPNPPYITGNSDVPSASLTYMCSGEKGTTYSMLCLRGGIDSNQLFLDIMIWTSSEYGPGYRPPEEFLCINLSESPYRGEILMLLHTHAPKLIEAYQSKREEYKEQIQRRLG